MPDTTDYLPALRGKGIETKSVSPRRETQLDTAWTELCNIHDRLLTIARRTNSIADEVVGMRPPSPDSPTKEEEPYTKVDKLRVKMGHINAVITTIDGIVDRLESI